jgi:hypothetical protein
MAGGAEEYTVAGSGPAMGVRRGVGRIVVRAEIGFDFDDAAGKVLRAVLVFDPMDEDLAEQARSHDVRLSFEEGAG